MSKGKMLRTFKELFGGFIAKPGNKPKIGNFRCWTTGNTSWLSLIKPGSNYCKSSLNTALKVYSSF